MTVFYSDFQKIKKHFFDCNKKSKFDKKNFKNFKDYDYDYFFIKIAITITFYFQDRDYDYFFDYQSKR